MYTIYGLSDGGSIRYVGVSTKDEAYVLSHHRSAARSAKKRTPVNEWVLSVGDRLRYKEIATVTAEQKADRFSAVVDALRSAGVDLLNVTKEAHAAKVKKAMADPEVRSKISEASRGRVNTPEHRKAISEANKGRVITPEHRAIISERHRGKIVGPETRKKISEKALGHTRNLGKVHSEEAKAKMSLTKHTRNHFDKGIIKEGCKHCNP